MEYNISSQETSRKGGIIRIAVVCPHYGYINRGTENATKDTNKYLERRGHEINVFSLVNTYLSGLRKTKGLGKFSDVFFEKTMLGGFSRKYLGFEPNLEDIVFSWKLNFLKHIIYTYDLLWSSGEYWCAKSVMKLSKDFKINSLLFFGGGNSAMMIKEAKMYPDIFAVMTPIMQKWVKEKVPDCNVKTIVGGVDLDFFRPTGPQYNLDNCEHPIVLTTSAFLASKRLDLVVKAMQKQKGTLIMTSDGPQRDKICKLGNKLLGNRFKYLGVLPFDEIPNLCRASDVLVMASDNEPYGRTVLEAMACNKPVIACRDPTREWMVDEGGILLDNIKDLPQAITEASEKDFDIKPRRQAEKFGWEKTVDMYEQAFREIGL